MRLINGQIFSDSQNKVNLIQQKLFIIMSIRLSSKEFQAQFGSSLGNQVVGGAPKKPAIRLPKLPKRSKAEDEYERILLREFNSLGCEVRYGAFSFKLAGGLYTPDFTVWNANRLLLCVEVKGSYRLHSASRSHMAFKEARAKWLHIRWRFAQWTKEGWAVAE